MNCIIKSNIGFMIEHGEPKGGKMNTSTNAETKETLCITVAEMARQLGIGITNAYKICKKKEFYPACRIQNRIVVNFKQLQKWLEERNTFTFEGL